jgi:hypothetical protein
MRDVILYRAGLLLPVLLATAAAAPAADDYVIPPAKLEHWAWQRPVRPAVPAVRERDWLRTPVDAFGPA